MAEPFLSEIRLFSFNFPPKGWAFCNGQFLPINQNQALFALLGTVYGGNGQTTFALPNLQGRVPIHKGNGFTLGAAGGEQSHTVTMQEMAAHNHFVNAVSTGGTTQIPNSSVMLAGSSGFEFYHPLTNPTTLDPATITNFGGSQAHENRQPFLTLNYCIALQGIFPSQN